MMIGLYADAAPLFIQIVCTTILVVFCLPLTLATLTWARLMRWTLPDDPLLALYFGRCTGLLGGAICLFGLCTLSRPVLMPGFFLVFAFAMVAMLLLHVWGAVRRQQPLSETLEIGLWIVLLAATLACFPTWPAAS